MIEIVPKKIMADPIYTEDDFKLFVKEVCHIVALPTLEQVIKQNCYNPREIKEFIFSVARGIYFYDVRAVTEGQKKYHQQLHKIMYEIPFEDLPLYINDDPDVTPAVSWRLKIGK